jgi:hypothetical protein
MNGSSREGDMSGRTIEERRVLDRLFRRLLDKSLDRKRQKDGPFAGDTNLISFRRQS